MATKCNNCGQAVAVTDDQCWHCGQTVTPQTGDDFTEPETVPLPELRVITRYAALTAVSLLLLILATRAIGQAPLLQFGSGNTPIVGWQTVTDAQFHFTLDMPETWQRIDLAAADSAILPIHTLEQRLQNLVADGRLLLLSAETQAAANSQPSFVLISRSQRFTQLSPAQFLAYAQQEAPKNLEILNDTIITDNPGPARGQLRFNLTVANGRYRCLEQFIPTDNIVYLVTTCTLVDKFISQQEEFETILRSFQPLES